MKSATAEKVNASSLRAELASNPKIRLLDVRTTGEYQGAHIDGSINIPLDQVEANLPRIAGTASGRMIVICQSGGRATEAARTLSSAGVTELAVLEQGMNGWVAAGAPVKSVGRQRWALDRQVRLVAGGIVASSILGSIWDPRLRFLAGGIGAGLVYSAVSNTCTMGMMLMKLPYNRGSEADIEKALDCLCS
ncbi:MAG: rhodanese-like domain-containing protein [Actinomycetota bacterium]|nr:rhodanese-like domain-containing protein [Actinomycetota bacterium]